MAKKSAAGSSSKKTTKKKTAKTTGTRKTSARKTTKKAKKTANTSKTARKTTKKTSVEKPVKKKTTKKTRSVKKKVTAPTTTKKGTRKTGKTKKTPAAGKKTTKKTENRISLSQPSLRQLSQAVSTRSSAARTLKSTSQEIHTKAALELQPLPQVSKRKRAKRLTKKQLKHFQDLLILKRAELLGDVKTMEKQRSKNSGELSHTPQHMADQGTDNYQKEFTLGLVEFERRMLGEIEEALKRIKDGTYGICQLTGQPISISRLEAKPWAKYCIEAARKLEQSGKR